MKDKPILGRLLTIPRFWGPLFTIVFTTLYHLGSIQFGYTVAVGWLWMIMIYGSFIAGVRASLICAAWVAGYSIYVDGSDPTLLAQRIAISFMMALTVGYLHRWLRIEWGIAHEAAARAEENEAKAHALDELNGNLEQLRSMHKRAMDLVLGWSTLNDSARYEAVRSITHDLAQLTSITQGWHYLYKEREAVIEAGERARDA